MPNTDAAKKTLRKNKKQHEQNLKRKKRMKGVIKEYKTLVEKGKEKKAKKQLSEVYKILDKLVKVHYIKEGKAKRIKSRLAKKLHPKNS